MADRPPAPLLTAALATLLALEALRAFLSTIYFRNLSSLGINASVLWALLLLAPALLLLPALARRPAATAVAALAAVAVLRPSLNLTWGSTAYLPLAGLAAAAWLVALPALFRSAPEGDGWGLAAGVVAGLAADTGLLALAASRDLSVLPAFFPAAAVAGAALLVLAVRLRPQLAGAAEGRGGVAAGIALGGWIFLEFALLAAPWHVARWNGAAVPPVLVASLLGLALGGAFLASARPISPAWTRAGALLVLAFLLDHGFLHSPLLPGLLLLAQVGMVLQLRALAPALASASARGAAVGMLLGSLAALVLLFAFAFAYQFAFVPASALWEGRAPLFLLAGLLLLVLGAARAAQPAGRARFPAALLAALLLLPLAAALVPLAVPAETAAPRGGGALRVATFNLHQGFNNEGVLDPDLFVRVVREVDADLVVLQESDTPRFTSGNLDMVSVLARHAGYPHVLYGPATRDQSVGLTLLSRLPLADGAVVRLPTPVEGDNRFLLRARVEANGTSLHVLGIHMGLPAADRMAQIAVILEAARSTGGPVVLLGDFNSCPQGTCPREEQPPDTVYAQLVAEYRDAWTRATGRAATDAAGATYGAPEPYQRIDYIFVSPQVTVAAAAVVSTPPALAASDHLPVLADLRL